MAIPIIPSVPGNFGSTTSPFDSIVATTGGVSISTVLPVGWVQGLLGAHSTLQLNSGTTAISTSPTTLVTANNTFGPLLSDGSSFSIVDDTTGSVSYYWKLRSGTV